MNYRSFNAPPEVLQIRAQFQRHIINAIKHQPAPVVFVGSMALHMHLKRFWGEGALTHIMAENMPKGINDGLITYALVPRDIDLLLSSSVPMEAAKAMAAEWMQQAINNHPSPLPEAEMVKTAELKLYSPAHVTTASVLYLKNGISNPKNILYSIDLVQQAESSGNQTTEIEKNIRAKTINDIIRDEANCITMYTGGSIRALKAVIRLCTLAILETRDHQLGITARTLLSDALHHIADTDKVINQLVRELRANPPLSNGDLSL